MANRDYDQGTWERDRDARRREDHGDERGWFERTGDEVRSWFGDDDAERRRRMDERGDERRERYDYDNGSDYRHNYGRYGYDSDRVRRDLDRENQGRSYDRDYDRSYGRHDDRAGYGGDTWRESDRDWHGQQSLIERGGSRDRNYYGNRGWGGERDWSDEERRRSTDRNWNDDRRREEYRGWNDDRNWNDDRDRSMGRSQGEDRNWNAGRGTGSYQDQGRSDERNRGGDNAYQGYGGDYERYDRSSYAGLSNYRSGSDTRRGERDRDDRERSQAVERRGGRMW